MARGEETLTNYSSDVLVHYSHGDTTHGALYHFEPTGGYCFRRTDKRLTELAQHNLPIHGRNFMPDRRYTES
jgi:hypothetical protein